MSEITERELDPGAARAFAAGLELAANRIIARAARLELLEVAARVRRDALRVRLYAERRSRAGATRTRQRPA